MIFSEIITKVVRNVNVYALYKSYHICTIYSKKVCPFTIGILGNEQRWQPDSLFIYNMNV